MTSWASYRFGDIHAMIASVDAGALRGLGERWRASADLIKQHAGSLADETEKLHQDWRSPTAADLFQDNVTKSVARIGEWVRAADRKAGNLSQAATDVLASQSEMDKLRAERETRLASAKTAEEKEAIEKEYDRLARAEGQSLGGKLAALTPWQEPAGYTGLIGLAPKGSTSDTVAFTEEVTFGEAPEETVVAEPADASAYLSFSESGPGPAGGSPIPGTVAALPPLLGMPLAPLPAGAGPAAGSLAGPGVAGRLSGLGGRVALGSNGYVPAGLFGRLAGASSLPGALTPGVTGAAGAGMPMMPPQGGAYGALSGRRTRTRRPVPYEAQPPVDDQTQPQEPDGPPAVSGRPVAVGKAATPRDVVPQEKTMQSGMTLGG